MSIYAYQPSWSSKRISQAPVLQLMPLMVLQMMAGIIQMLHHFYHEFPLLAEVVTLFNYKYVTILWL